MAGPEVQVRTLLIVTLGLVTACTPDEVEDTGPDLPDTDTEWHDTGEPWEYVDTGGGLNIDDVPDHLLTIRQWGSWNMGPPTGPYNTLSGDLLVQEYLDGFRPDTGDTGGPPPIDTADTGLTLEEGLVCDATYNVAGVPVTAGEECAGCSFTFLVQFSLVDGDPSTCHDPNLPSTGDEWAMGYHPGDEVILVNLGDSGLWTPWYNAVLAGDIVDYLWEVEVGIAIEEEEDP